MNQKDCRGYIYILRSNKTGSYYLGSTNDLERRVREHKEGRVKATKYLLPVELCFSQIYFSLIEARRIEYRLKTFKSKDVLSKIIKDRLIEIKGT